MQYKLVFITSHEFEVDDKFSSMIGDPRRAANVEDLSVGVVLLSEELNQEQLDYLTDLEQSHKWFSWRVF